MTYDLHIVMFRTLIFPQKKYFRAMLKGYLKKGCKCMTGLSGVGEESVWWETVKAVGGGLSYKALCIEELQNPAFN